MSHLGVTLVIEPPDATLGPQPRGVTPTRVLCEYDRFAGALGERLASRVEVAEENLAEVSRAGLILLHPFVSISASLETCTPERRRELARRVVLLDAHQPRIPELLERQHLAGAIGRHRYLQWTWHPDESYGGGLYGLKAIASTLGAECADDEQSEHYCLIERSPAKNLPSLVAAYARAWSV